MFEPKSGIPVFFFKMGVGVLAIITLVSVAQFDRSVGAAETDTLAPHVPQNLSVTARDGALDLSWKESHEDDLFTFLAYIKADGENDFREPAYTGRGTSYSLTGLENGRAYTVALAAKDNAGNVSARTPDVVAIPNPSADTGSLEIGAWIPVGGGAGSNALASFASASSLLNVVHPVWYSIASNGNLVPQSGAPDQQLLSSAHAKHIAVYPTITNNFDKDDVASMLIKSPAAQEASVNAIVTEVVGRGYDGIDIDFENLLPETRASFTLFIERLANALHERGKKLSITVQAKGSDQDTWRGAGATDFAAVGRVADRVNIMTYDFHRTNTTAGPIAPLDWVKQTLTYAKEKISSEKIVVGIPQYGYAWCEGTESATCKNQGLLWEGVQNIIRQYNPPVEWDERTSTPWFLFFDSSNNRKIVYFEDHRSMAAKLAAVQELGLSRVVLWRLGGEDPENFATLEPYAGKNQIPPAGISVRSENEGMTVSWDALAREEVTGYRVYFSSEPDGERHVDVLADVTSYHLGPLKNGTPYTVSVAALRDDGSEYSKSASSRATPSDLEYPGSVIDLKVQQVSEGTIDIAFLPSGDDYFYGTAAQFDIRTSNEPITGGNFGKANQYPHIPEPASVGVMQTWQLQGLIPGTKYYIGMKALDEAGNASDLSTVVEATTLDTTPPSPPQNLKVAAGDGTVSVLFDPSPESDTAFYKVYWKEENSYYNVLELKPGVTRADIGGLKNRTQYTVSVASVDTHGNESPRGEEITVKPTAGSITNRIAKFLTDPAEKLKASTIAVGQRFSALNAIPYLVVIAVFVINFFVYQGLKLEIQKNRQKADERLLSGVATSKKKRIMKF